MKRNSNQFTSIASFFVRDSFLRLLDVSFDFHSKCVLFVIINSIFIGLLCGGPNQTQGPLYWMVCQTQITVHGLENLPVNWKM